MKNLINKIKSISRVQLFAIILIIVGISIMIPKGLGMFEFYKEVKYANDNNFRAGNLSPDLLRPWMTIRYIAVAYAIPQEYLLKAANIQPKEENSMIALNRLNSNMKLGKTNTGPEMMNTIKRAIIAYRANPVVTGLIERNVSDWMSVQYIANSTGIPAEGIFKQLGISKEGNAYLPLGFLSDTVNFQGGPKALVAALQKIVDSQGVQPVQP
jgi:hypothetical protein